MIGIRLADERGHANHGWLDSRFTFSFANYYDPNWVGFSDLRVINDDRIAGGGGFPTHPHKEMEILTIVLEGAIAHRDSTGSGSTIRYGQFQLMSAGTGISHSEFNPLPNETTRLLQIWMIPNQTGVAPRYQESNLDPTNWENKWQPVATPEATDGALEIRADVRVHVTSLKAGETLTLPYTPGRLGWLQIGTGSIRIAGETAGEGDGIALLDENEAPVIEATRDAFLVFFDLRDPRVKA